MTTVAIVVALLPFLLILLAGYVACGRDIGFGPATLIWVAPPALLGWVFGWLWVAGVL